MEIITDIENMTPVATVATIGSFDGVHLGHRAMIAEARQIASARGLPFTAISFVRHPRLLFDAGCGPFLLTQFEDKISHLISCSVERCVLLPFDKDMASLTAREFMSQILCKRLGVTVLAVGYDHRFGHPQPDEDFEQYVAYGKDLGMEVYRMSPYFLDGDKISSSVIRRLLVAGDVSGAARLLGRNYSLRGKVVHGAAVGRSIGYPTANISLDEPMQLLPLDGVYECRVHLSDKLYQGVMNIGCKPTLGGEIHTVEVFLIDFSGDIYDADVNVEFVRRLRDEQRFENLNELRDQIERDVESVLNDKISKE